ncbi:MAG: hypothetical protein BWY68_00826 [bacterium ADurb.Bin400]|nr:MAG: hypothetical protein BWY68_00826 [bacterium ADurb.Bin400]
MSQTPRDNNHGAAKDFGAIFTEFGSAIAEIFDDPKLKEKAKDLGKSAVESAQALGSRFKDEEVKNKFRNVSKAAERFGKDVANYVKRKEK